MPGPVGSVAPSRKFSYGKVVRSTRPRPRVALAPCSRGESPVMRFAAARSPGNFASPVMRFAAARPRCFVRPDRPVTPSPGQFTRQNEDIARPRRRHWLPAGVGKRVAEERATAEAPAESFVPSWAPIARLRRRVVTTAAVSRRVSIGRRAPGSRAGSDAGVRREREREREQDKGVRRL